MEVRLKEPDFCRWQPRWAGTEARIAIVKNHGGGRVWRAKGLKHRLPEGLQTGRQAASCPKSGIRLNNLDLGEFESRSKARIERNGENSGPANAVRFPTRLKIPVSGIGSI